LSVSFHTVELYTNLLCLPAVSHKLRTISLQTPHFLNQKIAFQLIESMKH